MMETVVEGPSSVVDIATFTERETELFDRLKTYFGIWV